MDITRERQGGVLVVGLRGRLDNESAADLELLAQEVIASGERHLVIDLGELGYLSNAGLRVLGSLGKSLNTPTTSLRIAGPTQAVRQVFESGGAGLQFDIRPSIGAALADHPAARGGMLAQHVARLLGLSAAIDASPPPKGIDKLAQSAFDLLSGTSNQPRAARAVAQGTQVMRRVVPVPGNAGGGQAAAPAEKKLSFWQRLFGRKKK